jgi:hypothetical protein
MTIDHILLLLILCITVSTLIVVSVKKSDEGYLYSSSDSTTISGTTTFKSTGPFINDVTNKSMDIPADSLIEKIYLKINFDDVKDTSPQCFKYKIGAVSTTGQVDFTNELSYDEVSKGVFVDKLLINTTTDKIVSVSWWSDGAYQPCNFLDYPSGSLHAEVTYKNNK